MGMVDENSQKVRRGSQQEYWRRGIIRAEDFYPFPQGVFSLRGGDLGGDPHERGEDQDGDQDEAKPGEERG